MQNRQSRAAILFVSVRPALPDSSAACTAREAGGTRKKGRMVKCYIYLTRDKCEIRALP